MAFADHVVKPGAGVVYKVEISLDNFATTYATWATHGGGVNDYDDRIVSVGPIQRGLGEDRAMMASSVEIVVGNTDGAADWLVLPESANRLKARFKLYVGVYTPTPASGGGPAADDWKQLGEFILNDSPRMTANEISLTLDDDVLGQFEVGPLVLPTIKQALSADLTEAMVDYSRYLAGTVQLAWGGPGNYVECKRAFWGIAASGTYKNKAAFVVCCTSRTDAVTNADITDVQVELFGYEGRRTLPETWTDETGTEYAIWTRVKSTAFSTGDGSGRSFRTLWIAIDDKYFWEWHNSQVGVSGFDPSDPSTGFEFVYFVGQTSANLAWANAIKGLWVAGSPFSGRTNTGTKQLATDVISDLCTYYYPKQAITVDATSKARVAAVLATDPSPCAGAVGGWAESSKPKTYRQHISDICDSFDFDAFLRWDGQMGFCTANMDYTATVSIATLSAIEEERIGDDFSLQHPTREQRHAPFNRIVNREADGDIIKDFVATQSDMGRILTRKMSRLWRTGAPISVAGVELEAHEVYGGIRKALRPFVEFTTDISALLLELGDLVTVTFTGGGVRSWLTNAIHQVEDICFVPEQNVARLKLLWLDDLRSKRSYILDDEDLLVRVTASGGRTITVTDSYDIMVASSGDFDAEGVTAGDFLVLQDATEADDSFKRFRCIRIDEMLGSTQIRTDDPDLDFGAPSGVAVASWKIVRGQGTYPTAAGDPTNYAQGGWIYGRISQFVGGTYGYEYENADPETSSIIGHRMRRG